MKERPLGVEDSAGEELRKTVFETPLAREKPETEEGRASRETLDARLMVATPLAVRENGLERKLLDEPL